MAVIQFIGGSFPYQVNFREFAEPVLRPESETSRITKVVLALFKAIQIFFSSSLQATYDTARYASIKLRTFVLGTRAEFFRTGLYVHLFRIGLLIAAVIRHQIVATFQYAFKGFCTQGSSASNSFLESYASKGINVGHIQTNEAAISVSQVSQNVRVNDLLTMFDRINFTYPNAPGYMNPADQKDEVRTYTFQELRDRLVKFIKDINDKVPFVGTPRADDVAGLAKFYQQIEDAVRFSIHKVNTDLRNFLTAERLSPDEIPNEATIAGFNPMTLQQYNWLLEDQARLAIDLAIAGNHCGGRYMGEAMRIYYLHRLDRLSADSNLKDTLIEILANKRKEIVEILLVEKNQPKPQLNNQQLQINTQINTHQYNEYMENMGRLVKLPGTQGISDRLSSRNFQPDQELREFFGKYTINCIIDTIQDKIKNPKSAGFRQKIIEWIQEQSRDWKKDRYEALIEPLQERIAEIRDADDSVDVDTAFADKWANIAFALELLNDFKAKIVSNLNEVNWDNALIEHLFSLPVVEERMQKFGSEKFPGKSNQRIKKIQQIKTCLFKESLGPETFAYLFQQLQTSNSLIESDTLKPLFLKNHVLNKKVASLRGLGVSPNGDLIPFSYETTPLLHHLSQNALHNLLNPQASLESIRTTLVDALEHARRTEFFDTLCSQNNLDQIKEDGLSPAMMEWLLVANGILNPQLDEDA